MLGPLATYAEPHCYDLCAEHAERLTAPRGWEVVRLAPDPAPPRPCNDDLRGPGGRRPRGGPPAHARARAGGPGAARSSWAAAATCGSSATPSG